MNAEIRFDDHPTLRLEGSSLTLGRSDTCDLQVKHERVSKQHARLSTRGGRWFIADLGSANGVRVEGEKISTETKLEHGDTISFGSVRATFYDPDSVSQELPRYEMPAQSGAQPAPSARPTPPIPPPTRPAMRSRRGSRRSNGVGLLTVSAVVFAALFGVIYVVYQTTLKPAPVVSKSGVPANEPPKPRTGPDQALGIRITPPGPPAGGRPRDTRATDPRPDGAIDVDSSLSDRSKLTEFTDRGAPPREPGASPNPPRPLAGDATTASSLRAVPPPANPFAGADQSGDALRLARLVSQYPGHAEVDSVRERLRSAPIIAVQWEGGLPPTAERVLIDRMLPNCSVADRSKIEKLGLGVSFVDCTIEVRYMNHYKTGLGRRVGDTRLAPHPKTIEIEVRRTKANGKRESLVKLEFKTPRLSKGDLKKNGLSNEEVWSKTIETKLERLNRALAKLSR